MVDMRRSGGRKGVGVPLTTTQLHRTPLVMLPPMGLRYRPIEQCSTIWFNVDFFEIPCPDWKVDVDVSRRVTYFSHTTPGETIVGHPVHIKLEKPGIVWIATNRFCRMGGPFAEVLIEARWPD